MVLAATVLALVVKLGSYNLGLSAQTAQVYDLFIFFAAGLLTTFLIEWRMWLTAVAYLTAFVIGASRPELSLWAMAASNAVLAATAVYVWRQRGSSEVARGQATQISSSLPIQPKARRIVQSPAAPA
jgi:hypothetical protein